MPHPTGQFSNVRVLEPGLLCVRVSIECLNRLASLPLLGETAGVEPACACMALAGGRYWRRMKESNLLSVYALRGEPLRARGAERDIQVMNLLGTVTHIRHRL